MRRTLMAGVAAIGLMIGSQAANADFFFAGAGLDGVLVAPTETWHVGSDDPPAGVFGLKAR